MSIELVNSTLVTLKIKKNLSPKPTKSKKKYMKNIKVFPSKIQSYSVEKGEEKVDNDGILEFLKDVSINPLDPVTLVFSYLCRAKTMVYSSNE